MIKCCKTCRWRSDSFISVCVNDESDHLADFVEADTVCPEWEGKDENMICWLCKKTGKKCTGCMQDKLKDVALCESRLAVVIENPTDGKYSGLIEED